MRSFVYPAKLIPETAGFTVQFGDFPEAITSGVDRADAISQAADCLEEAIAGRIADGLDLPAPSQVGKRQIAVNLTAPMAAKAALYLALKDGQEPHSKLARRLKIHERELRRMLDPRHPTKLVRIQTVLQALGKRLIVSLDDAA
jgi:antitoxin HicB